MWVFFFSWKYYVVFYLATSLEVQNSGNGKVSNIAPLRERIWKLQSLLTFSVDGDANPPPHFQKNPLPILNKGPGEVTIAVRDTSY